MNKCKRVAGRSGIRRLSVVFVLFFMAFFVSTFLNNGSAYAADLQNGCAYGVAAHDGVAGTGTYISPFGSTPNVCLGRDQGYFFQLAVTIPDNAVSANPVVTAFDNKGRRVPMIKDTRETLFVSSVPVHVPQTSTQACDTSLTVTITVKMTGVNPDQTTKLVMCSSGNPSGAAHDTWVRTYEASGPGDSGTARQFVGYIGINYGEALTTDPESQYAVLQQGGIRSITITGGNCDTVNCKFNSSSPEVSLTDGYLKINAKSLAANAFYKISLNYSARAVDKNAPDEWMDHTFTFDNGGAGFKLNATGDTVITPDGYSITNLAYYDINNVAAPKGVNDKDPTTQESQCTAGTLGWVMCPLVNVFQDIINWAASIMDSMLFISPIGSNDDLQKVWRTFVGFANLILIVAFLVVIFSQATSVGLSAYGIKKMLPRIIAAAILINASYFVCTVALDVINILGKSAASLMTSLMPTEVQTSSGTQLTDKESWANWIGVIVLGVIPAGIAAAATGAIAFLVPVLLSAALAIVAIFLIIAFRQMIIILLVIAAPLAFAAMILPNTEQLFTKWRKLFTNMLIMYPVVMFLLYGAQLVGALLLKAKTVTVSGGGDLNNWMIDIVATLVMTIGPFAGLYMYLKNSNKLMSMASGLVNKLGAGRLKAAQDWAGQKQKNSKWSRAREDRRAAINEAAARRAYTNPGLMSRLGGGVMRRDARQIMEAKAANANDKIESEAINQAVKSLPYYNPTARKDDRARMAKDAFQALQAGDLIKAQAISAVAAKAGADEFKDFHESLQSNMEAAPNGWTPQRIGQMKQINSRVLKDFGGDLRPKNLALTSALERSFNDVDESGKPVGPVSISKEMESEDMQNYYKVMGAQQISVFSTDTAKVAAKHVNDRALKDVIENENIRGSMKKGTREAYEAVYSERFGALPATPSAGGTPPPAPTTLTPPPDTPSPDQDTLPGM